MCMLKHLMRKVSPDTSWHQRVKGVFDEPPLSEEVMGIPAGSVCVVAQGALLSGEPDRGVILDVGDGLRGWCRLTFLYKLF